MGLYVGNLGSFKRLVKCEDAIVEDLHSFLWSSTTEGIKHWNALGVIDGFWQHSKPLTLSEADRESLIAQWLLTDLPHGRD